jgi:hypothetical protein
MLEVREITQYEQWDRFVELSPQGSVFATARWMKLFDKPFKILGVFREYQLVGGLPFFERDISDVTYFDSGGVNTPLTPFQGVLLQNLSNARPHTINSLEHEVIETLLKYLEGKYDRIVITNNYNLRDMRPFIWNGYQSEIKYTYLIDEPLLENLEPDTRYEINRASKINYVREGTCAEFDLLYTETFKRKGMERPVSSQIIHSICDNFNPSIYIDNLLSASVFIIHDTKRWYYILGASDGKGASSMVLWSVLQGKSVDMVGANSETIARFKRGFGGKLVSYYGVKK